MPIIATNPFKGRHYPGEVILSAVRWYLRYPLAYQHVSELLAERALFRRCQLRLAMGAGVCARTEQALPTASEDNNQELPRGRNVH
jgi:hypothetical protein